MANGTSSRKKRIFILLPDGVGLRNFAFTSFVEIGRKKGWEVTFWNNTPFDLTQLGFSEIKLTGKPQAKTDLLKRAKIEVELDHFTNKFNDQIYQTYKFPASNNGFKRIAKNVLVSALINSNKGEKGLEQLRKKLRNSERKGNFYRHCKEVLQREKPDFILCTNQRPVSAIAPLTAAHDLGIPTASFIFSWDNLPKATMVVESDHYFVWSEFMEQELLHYYPFINPAKIHVTGSPQFEPHFDPSLRKSRDQFFQENGLDTCKKYICFSGDDITTSPDDPQYLQDIAEAVEILNKEGENLGILFRRSPVDHSERYNKILDKFQNTITSVAPMWKNSGDNWDTVLPMKEDLELQINSILHTEAVVNLASSMVFDFAVFDKPCLYINYEVGNKLIDDWSPQKVYNFVHFRSMPSGKPVLWLNNRDEIKEKLILALNNSAVHVEHAKIWFKRINAQPPEKASSRIWEVIDELS